MKHESDAPRRYLSAVGGVVDLDELLTDQERRKVELKDELARTQARLEDAEHRFQADEPHRYSTIPERRSTWLRSVPTPEPATSD